MPTEIDSQAAIIGPPRIPDQVRSARAGRPLRGASQAVMGGPCRRPVATRFALDLGWPPRDPTGTTRPTPRSVPAAPLRARTLCPGMRTTGFGFWNCDFRKRNRNLKLRNQRRAPPAASRPATVASSTRDHPNRIGFG